MKEIFADSFYFLSLLNPRDQAHKKATDASRSIVGKLVTTEYVLIEVGDALSRPAYRERFLDLLAALRLDSNTEIVPAGPGFLEKGLDLFRGRPDKDWPLTDCLSFVLMTERRIDEALTGDDHFRQAGFTPVLV
jgi:predicted nucleic acid-binding protein